MGRAERQRKRSNGDASEIAGPTPACIQGSVQEHTGTDKHLSVRLTYVSISHTHSLVHTRTRSHTHIHKCAHSYSLHIHASTHTCALTRIHSHTHVHTHSQARSTTELQPGHSVSNLPEIASASQHWEDTIKGTHCYILPIFPMSQSPWEETRGQQGTNLKPESCRGNFWHPSVPWVEAPELSVHLGRPLHQNSSHS